MLRSLTVRFLAATLASTCLAASPYEYDVNYQLGFLGDEETGKTTLAKRVTSGGYFSNPGVTVGSDFYTFIEEIQDKRVRIQLWDLAGKETFRAIRDSLLRGLDGIFIVFDRTKHDTLGNIGKWYTKVERHVGQENPPIFLVATKSDLEADEDSDIDEEAEALVKKLGLQGYIKTSAKTGENATKEDLLVPMVKVLLQQKKKLVDHNREQDHEETLCRRPWWLMCGG